MSSTPAMDELGVVPLYSRQDLMSNLKNIKDINHLFIYGVDTVIGSNLALKMALMGVPMVTLVESGMCNEDPVDNMDAVYPVMMTTAGGQSEFIRDEITSRRIRKISSEHMDQFAQMTINSAISSGRLVIPPIKEFFEEVRNEATIVHIVEKEEFQYHMGELRSDGNNHLVIGCFEKGCFTDYVGVWEHLDWAVYQEPEGNGLCIVSNPHLQNDGMDNMSFSRPAHDAPQTILTGLFANYIFSEKIREDGYKKFVIYMDDLYNGFFNNANLTSYEEGDVIDSGLTFDFNNEVVEELEI